MTTGDISNKICGLGGGTMDVSHKNKDEWSTDLVLISSGAKNLIGLLLEADLPRETMFTGVVQWMLPQPRVQMDDSGGMMVSASAPPFAFPFDGMCSVSMLLSDIRVDTLVRVADIRDEEAVKHYIDTYASVFDPPVIARPDGLIVGLK